MRKFARINQNELEQDASTLDWSDVLQSLSMDTKVDCFRRRIIDLYDKHALIYCIKMKRPTNIVIFLFIPYTIMYLVFLLLLMKT